MQLPLFEPLAPSDAAWRARVARIDPRAYARTRNALDGRVTGLSPWITHGFVTAREVLAELAPRFDLTPADKLVMELGWREYWHHVWGHVGERILADLRPPVYAGRYASEVPADVLEARSGVPAVDVAVRTLHATGTLHNHARMWLASYLTHVRKVHWAASAAWMYGHLLDGDLASNALSWQWVAGTFSHKPYLFNAANVARYAPPAWHSPGTVIDRSYEVLGELARTSPDVGPEPGRRAGTPAPALLGAPPPTLLSATLQDRGAGWWAPPGSASPPAPGEACRLIHPWDLAAPRPGGARRVGLLHLPFHTRFPWSERRWRFVLGRLAEVCDVVWLGDAAHFPIPGAHTATATLNPGYRERLAHLAACTPAPRFTPDPGRLAPSFSQFWAAAREDLLLG
ncbi:MAG: FAD-binding domain-containing protein [Candidatus Sericytochromatia bacterium]|nr:FAD-binding domain-containing protein [Candidatus Sericytochromatia bacterium]